MSNKTLIKYFKNKTFSKNIYLENKIFTNEAFKDFVVNPRKKHAFLSDVVFDSCKVLEGAIIGIDVTLKNILIKQLSVQTLHIHSEADMTNVVIEGNNKPSRIWIRQILEESEYIEDSASDFVALDISNYSGEVDITGMPSNIVKINPNEHVIINNQLFHSVDWKKLKLNPFSFWRIVSKKVDVSKSKEGIYSLPSQKDKRYKATMDEMEILQKEGFI